MTAARTLPMMVPRRVVLVFQADALLVPKREAKSAARALDGARDMIARARAGDRPRLRGRHRSTNAAGYSSCSRNTRRSSSAACSRSQADAERWVRNRVAAGGAAIDPAAARLLAQRGGTDVKRLRNDVERLLLYALGQKTITLDDAKEMAGPAALQDDWAMTNAIEAGDGAVALRQLALMLDAGAAPEKILGQLGWLVRSKAGCSRLAALRDAIDALLRTDLDLKRSAGEPRVLLERLVVELCAGRQSAARERERPVKATRRVRSDAWCHGADPLRRLRFLREPQARRDL